MDEVGGLLEVLTQLVARHVLRLQAEEAHRVAPALEILRLARNLGELIPLGGIEHVCHPDRPQFRNVLCIFAGGEREEYSYEGCESEYIDEDGIFA